MKPAYKPIEKRDQVWQSPRISQETARISAAVSSTFKVLPSKNAVEEIYKLIRKNRHHSDPLSQLRAYLYIIAVLKGRYSLGERKVQTLKRAAKQILQEQNVKPTSSRLSFLHGQLYAALSEQARKQGKLTSADWKQCLAEDYHRFRTSSEHLVQARALLRLGDATAAMSLLEGTDFSPEEKNQVRLLQMLALRLSGNCFSSLALFSDFCSKQEASKPIVKSLRWQEAICRVQLSQNPGILFSLLRTETFSQNPRYLIETALWCFSVRSREGLQRKPSTASILKLLYQTQKGDGLLPIAQYLLVLDKCYDDAIPLTERADALGEALENVNKVNCISMEMLMWAAASRWLSRTRQEKLLRNTLAHYRALSLSVSDGLWDDTLGVLSDIVENYRQPLVFQESLESGRFQRSRQIISLAGDLIFSLGRTRLQRFFRNKADKVRLRETEKEILTSIIVKHLRRLKGPLLKVGQTASYWGINLPPESQSELSLLQDSAIPLNPKAILSVIEKEFGKPGGLIFKTFDAPIGVGSIGQVHRAVLHDGTEVAVKVQYPEIEKVIRFDFRIIRSLIPLLNLFAPRISMTAIVNELENRVLKECDYLTEARMQSAFREKFSTHPMIRVPKVFPEYSSAKVLTTELVHGSPLKNIIEKGEPETKNKIGEALIDWVVGGCRDGLFNTDLHPGNFLLNGSHLICLDFGSIQQWTPETTRPWIQLIESCRDRDFEKFRKSVIDMKMVGEPYSFNFQYFYETETQGAMRSIAKDGSNSFRHEIIHTEFERLFGPSNPMLRKMSLDKDYLFGFRVYFGLSSLLAQLSAENPYHELMKKVLPGDSPR